MRPCPACGRKIQDAAQRCHYCHAPVPHARRAEPASAMSAPAARATPAKSRFGLLAAAVALAALLVGALLAFLR